MQFQELLLPGRCKACLPYFILLYHYFVLFPFVSPSPDIQSPFLPFSDRGPRVIARGPCSEDLPAFLGAGQGAPGSSTPGRVGGRTSLRAGDPAAGASRYSRLVSAKTPNGRPPDTGGRPLLPLPPACWRALRSRVGRGLWTAAVSSARGSCLREPTCSRGPACPRRRHWGAREGTADGCARSRGSGAPPPPPPEEPACCPRAARLRPRASGSDFAAFVAPPQRARHT